MKNQREIYEALLEGETLISVNFIKVKLKDDNLDITSIKETHISNAIFKNPNEWQIYKEPKWYENFPDGGVLCWCSDGVNKFVDIIIEHKPENDREYSFRTSNSHWPNATPLTLQEISVFVTNAPEDL